MKKEIHICDVWSKIWKVRPNSKVHGQGSLLNHFKIPSSGSCSAHVHAVPPVFLLLFVLLHHPVLLPQTSVHQSVMHSALFHTRPAFLPQAAVKVAQGGEVLRMSPPERGELHGPSAHAVRTFDSSEGVDRRLGATVVFVDAAGTWWGPSEGVEGLQLLWQLPKVSRHFLGRITLLFVSF